MYGGFPMEFKLNEYHRNVSDEELIQDIIRVASQLNSDNVTMKQYKEYGNYNCTTITNRFNGWINACKMANLKFCSKQVNNKKVSKIDIINDLKVVAENASSSQLSHEFYSAHGKYHYSTICKHFGSWNKAIIAAGLDVTQSRKINQNDFLKEIENVWIKLGRQPTTTDIKNGVSKYSLNSYLRHFGSWRKALETFVEYINNEENDTTEQNDNKVNNTPSNIKALNITKKNDMHKTKRDINLRLRFKVMQRDNFKCCMCGASPATDPNVVLHIDHIKPWSKGGETTIDNLQTLCSKCNLGKSDLEL